MKKASMKKKEAMSKVTITSDMQSESLVSQLLSYMIWRRYYTEIQLKVPPSKLNH